MKNLVQLFASLVLVFGLVTLSNAANLLPVSDGYKIYQSDTDATTEDEEKKKIEGEEEEEEPDC